MSRSRPSALLVLALPLAGSFASPGVPSPEAFTTGEVSSVTVTLGTAVELDVIAAVIPQPLGRERASLYLTIQSHSTTPDVLLGIEIPAAEHVSLHRSQKEGGITRMREVEGIEISAGARVDLRPGSYHAMLERLTASPEVGDLVPLRLHFRNAGWVEAAARVIPYMELEGRFQE